MILRPTTTWAVWLAARLVAILTLGLPGGDYVPSDLHLFALWSDALAHGTTISTDAWQYPPGVALVLAAAGLTQHSFAALLVVIVGSDAVLMARLVRTRGALLWALAGLLVGPMMLTRLDTLVTLVAVLGLTAPVATRSGLLLGLGASLKLWPGLLVSAPRGAVVRRALAAAAAYAATALVARALVASPSFVGNQEARGLQVESVAAWPFMLARTLGAPVDLVFRNGATEVAHSAADLVARWLLPLGVAAALVVLAWAWLRVPAADTGTAALVSLLVVLVLLVTSRVLSPQFDIWVLGLCALAQAHTRVPRTVLLPLAGTALAAQLLYPTGYPSFLAGGWVGLTIQTVRLVLLLVGLVAVLAHLRRHNAPRSGAPLPEDATGTHALA